jgi:predicted RNA-binding protein
LSRKDGESVLEGIKMCEFSVLLQDKTVFRDAVHAKADGKKVTVRNILGISKSFEDCTIQEVDVQSERLVLQTAKG